MDKWKSNLSQSKLNYRAIHKLRPGRDGEEDRFKGGESSIIMQLYTEDRSEKDDNDCDQPTISSSGEFNQNLICDDGIMEEYFC